LGGRCRPSCQARAGQASRPHASPAHLGWLVRRTHLGGTAVLSRPRQYRPRRQHLRRAIRIGGIAMRHRLSTLSVGLVLLVLLAGCGSGPTAPTNTAAPNATAPSGATTAGASSASSTTSSAAPSSASSPAT